MTCVRRLGKSMIFLKREVVDSMQERRAKLLTRPIVTLQCIFRNFRAKTELRTRRESKKLDSLGCKSQGCDPGSGQQLSNNKDSSSLQDTLRNIDHKHVPEVAGTCCNQKQEEHKVTKDKNETCWTPRDQQKLKQLHQKVMREVL
jgi:hypothetical protein